MQVIEAKNFLVQQVEEQARLESVTLSEIEKRMMYFTESEEANKDPVSLNEEFEAHYDNHKYEAKIAGLLRRALERLKKENSDKARTWKQAIRKLNEGDHYILVLMSAVPLSEHPKRDFYLQVGIGVLIAFLFAAGVIVKSWLFDK